MKTSGNPILLVAICITLAMPAVAQAKAAPKAFNGKTCTVFGTSNSETLVGTAKTDVICGLGGNDTIDGLGGNDTIDGGVGNDDLSGGEGNDAIDGGVGNDFLNGQNGNDALTGDSGNDSLNGGAGDDSLQGEAGADVFIGGIGTDAAKYSEKTTGLTLDIDNEADDGVAGENDNINTDVENITGGAGNDTITGNSVANTILGGLGNDSLDGGLGNDSLDGGLGNDSLNGQNGADVLVGGSGNDVLAGGIGDDSLAANSGSDKCVFPEADITLDKNSSCESMAIRVSKLLDEIAETFRPYSDTAQSRCVVNNCGERIGAYCIVNRATGYLDNCVSWDGFDGWLGMHCSPSPCVRNYMSWWDGMVHSPNDPQWGTNPGPYYPESNYLLFDRDKLPEWAYFVANRGTYVLGPNTKF